eukprot:6791180-Alexandrium_andersonii.AAC.1
MSVYAQGKDCCEMIWRSFPSLYVCGCGLFLSILGYAHLGILEHMCNLACRPSVMLTVLTYCADPGVFLSDMLATLG